MHNQILFFFFFPKENYTSKMQNFQGLLPLHAPALSGMCGDETSAAH
jgi:hypothetical protein